MECIHSRLFSYFYPTTDVTMKAIRVLYNRYTISIDLLLGLYFKMVHKTRSNRHLYMTSQFDLKRKAKEVEDVVEETVDLDDDEGCRSDSITGTTTQQEKCTKVSLTFMSTEFEERYFALNMANRTLLFVKPCNDIVLTKCGLMMMLDNLGIGSLANLPKICYPSYVIEFYANLHMDKFDNYILTVRNRQIVLNFVVLYSIMKFNVYFDKDIFTKKGVVKINGLNG